MSIGKGFIYIELIIISIFNQIFIYKYPKKEVILLKYLNRCVLFINFRFLTKTLKRCQRIQI